MVGEDVSLAEVIGRPHCLVIESGGKATHFAAQTADDLAGWIDALTAADDDG